MLSTITNLKLKTKMKKVEASQITVEQLTALSSYHVSQKGKGNEIFVKIVSHPKKNNGIPLSFIIRKDEGNKCIPNTTPNDTIVSINEAQIIINNFIKKL